MHLEPPIMKLSESRCKLACELAARATARPALASVGFSAPSSPDASRHRLIVPPGTPSYVRQAPAMPAVRKVQGRRARGDRRIWAIVKCLSLRPCSKTSSLPVSALQYGIPHTEP